ncbi:MAG: type II toxin-antitoxin system VapC family toxin [Sulfuricellaceae bacterium]
MIYLDTSVLGALFFREPTAPEILARLESAPKTALVISAWTLAEMASAGAIKERTGQIGARDRAAGLAAFQRFVADTLELVEVEPGDFRTAATLLDLPTTALRATDALHLAIAHRLRADMATLDRRQGIAANHYGIGLFPVA